MIRICNRKPFTLEEADLTVEVKRIIHANACGEHKHREGCDFKADPEHNHKDITKRRRKQEGYTTADDGPPVDIGDQDQNDDSHEHINQKRRFRLLHHLVGGGNDTDAAKTNPRVHTFKRMFFRISGDLFDQPINGLCLVVHGIDEERQDRTGIVQQSEGGINLSCCRNELALSRRQIAPFQIAKCRDG